MTISIACESRPCQPRRPARQSTLVRWTVLLCCIGVVACSERITIQQATLRPVASPLHDDAYILSVTIQREELEKIIKNHIFAYLQLVDCSSRKDLYTVLPQVNDVYMGNFETLEAMTRKISSRTFDLYGKLRIAKRLIGHTICATLDGGG